MAEEKSKRSEEKETGRLESFSDGIFAFAITLLVLGLADPVRGTGSNLLGGLIAEWPAFFAFFTSFLTILIMWVNHHNMFNLVVKIDTPFMFLNGFLLLTVTLTPFTTSLVADHLTDSNSQVAAAVYSGVFILLGIAWNRAWQYASKNRRLLSESVMDAHIKGVNQDYNRGMLAYFVAFGLALFNGLLGVLAVLLIAAFFAVTASSRVLKKEDSKPKAG